ncbi:trypsin-like peptidase domain-containing protein [Microcoleus sp. FACHB-68]|uniref:trypsin-like peptidase domain-containing protein n=1 Tax=Microcoleus sp. FACHB-68 TaxID=2692826 RepID=UPI0016867CB8|nr:trypsin-like peptidase domain-containing protein [Microcoleus sp. FACHB-68]MBD1940521.1 trypsin-like peptidase domain-containing protein [Microcoleus sp. FACHB-68]
MNTKLLPLATSGILAIATVIGSITIPALAPAGLLPSSRAFAQDVDEQTNIRVYEVASPAVVSIDAGSSNGSGTIISSEGLVLTNAHVVAGSPRNVSVILSDGRRVQAEVIAFGEKDLDLAVLKIRGQNNLPTIPLAPLGSVRVGQRAYAIGNPFGRFQGTFTVGIVSRIDRQRGLIQTDAAINPGNSGGPLLNSQGELIGVNTAIFTGRQGGNIGIGFAMSLDRVQPFLTAVREGRAPRVSQVQQQATASTNNNYKPQQIALNGAPVSGRLGPGSLVLRADNSFFNIYTFQGKAGQRISIEMDSQEIDPFLILLSPNGRDLGQDDDGGGGNSAKIEATLPGNGTYTLIANSSQPGESGSYNLRIVASGAGGDTRGNARNQGQQGNVIARLESVLGPGASVLPSDGSLFRQTTFTGRGGQSVTISLESPEFDTYLVLLSPEGKVLAQNDNAGADTTNSAITATLPRSGVYRVVVNARDRQGRGRYTLTIR